MWSILCNTIQDWAPVDEIYVGASSSNELQRLNLRYGTRIVIPVIVAQTVYDNVFDTVWRHNNDLFLNLFNSLILRPCLPVNNQD